MNLEGKMIKGIEHFSFTVSSLEDSLDFFCNKLGLKATPIVEVENADVQKIIGMPEAYLRISIVNLSDSNAIELIQYIRPEGKSLDLTTCNTGVAHLAFEVSDISALYERLSSQNIDFISPPVWTLSSDGQGQWGVCYLKGPDNITLELIEKK
jgi:catechol 2,3-dioxygenase-like lactoylglutathione lyase family enzyme